MTGPNPGRAELHLHLEGAISVPVLNRLGDRHGLKPLAPDALLVAGWHGSDDKFGLVLERLRGREDYRDATAALIDDLARQRIDYAEISIMPVIHVDHYGVALDDLWGGVAEAIEAKQAETGVQVRVLFAIPRNAGPAAGFATLRMIDRLADRRILGIDLAGTENPDTIAPFAPVYAAARASGLRTVAHAGEFGPASRVRETLRLLQPERIGHGLAAAQDPVVLAELAESGVPLEIALSSNVAFGAIERLDAHPIRLLYESGVPIVLATDDPALVDTTLEREYSLLSTVFALPADAIRSIADNSIRFAFTANPNCPQGPVA